MTMSKHSACLNILYLNARSILPKIYELHVLCIDNSCDIIICIVESWLSNEIANTELFVPGFLFLGIDMVEGLLFLLEIPYLALSYLLHPLPHIQLEFYHFVLSFVNISFVFLSCIL